MKHTICTICALLCILALVPPAGAAGYLPCFTEEDFGDPPLAGICITQLPQSTQGSVMLGSRQLRPGDVLTAEQVFNMTYITNQDSGVATISYLPVYADGLAEEATMTLSLRGKENKPPIAEDCAFETYKNLEITGKLRVQEPEQQQMQFAITQQPRRGTLTIQEDGSFTYTPKKNKIGVDSFRFTASDPAGKVSREATVTITILKPTDARQYSDTAGQSCRFAAEWMKNTGIFVGESLCGNCCFSPTRTVTRGEFLTMLVKTLEIPTDSGIMETGFKDVPNWLKPYLAAAVRSGLISAIATQESFDADQLVTAEDAAALLCSALHLTATQQATLSTAEEAVNPVDILTENGFVLTSGQVITRADAACLLYQAAQYHSNMPAPML